MQLIRFVVLALAFFVVTANPMYYKKNDKDVYEPGKFFCVNFGETVDDVVKTVE